MPTPEEELTAATGRILSSEHRKKLVVAGPGTGKTFLFKKLLEQAGPGEAKPVVVTFINTLTKDIKTSLGHLASVSTFHSFCSSALYRNEGLRRGLSDNFKQRPKLASFIKEDWELAGKGPAPLFVKKMCSLTLEGDEETFYLARGNYYDAVDFDDSVYRVYRQLKDAPESMEPTRLVLVDEYQDFNALEAALIETLGARSPIVIAGDDDQALYSQLRNASSDYIRALHRGGAYATFELPFCMRCTTVVVEATNDVIQKARDLGHLDRRINKPYKPYPPQKAADSARYPKVKVVTTSVQSRKANYFGRYIAKEICAIPEDEIHASRDGAFPAVLVVGPKHYLAQVEEYLLEQGIGNIQRVEREGIDPTREEGLQLLKQDPASNLGWRILLRCDSPIFTREVIARSVTDGSTLSTLIAQDYKERILAEAATLRDPNVEESPAPPEDPRPTVRLVSFEGSKGLSAQHVFIVGLQDGVLPRSPGAIGEIEICRMIVALTRTRKQCHLISTTRFSGKPSTPSSMIGWIKPERCERVYVNAAFWRAQQV